MGRIKESWYERREVQKVTLDFIKSNCNLTDREKELLKLIYDRKLVRRDLLEIISPSYRMIGRNRSILLNRSIKRMYKGIIIDKVHETQKIGRGNTPCIVALDKGGSLLLGVPHKKRIIHNKTIVNGKEYITRKLPSNYRHIHGINQMEVDTILFCENDDSKLIEWRHEQYNTKIFFYGDNKVILIPDVFMILNIKNKPFVAFIEFDTGSENLRMKEPPIIKEKIIKYKQYMKSRLWLEEDWQKLLPQPQFPILLFVTMDEKRIDFFNQKSKEMGVRGLGIYYKNYYKVLEKMATLID